MPTTIDSLEIEIQSNSTDASDGLQKLYNTLDKLKNVTKGGAGLSSVSNALKRLSTSIETLSSGDNLSKLEKIITSLNGLKSLQGIKLSSTIANSVSRIGAAVQSLDSQKVSMLGTMSTSLNSLGGVKISSTIGKGIEAISSAAVKLDASAASKITELSNALATLLRIQSLKISSSLANQIVKLGDAAKSIQGIDFSVFGNLAEKLHPLTELGKSNLGSMVSALKKLPEVANSLNSIDLDTFEEKIRRIAAALEPLATQMNAISRGFASFPTRIQRLITSTNGLSGANNGAANSYLNLYAKLKMATAAVHAIGAKIAQFINKSNQYIENVNLFNASMGKYANEAQRYAEKVGDVVGIDPGEWMRNQGVFMTLATGFGVVSDRAYIMSKNLTQLGYDLSSFFNISYEDAMQKLQSGFSGELEPLRRLGFDLSQARLKAIALELGIKKTFNSMTQAEKAQLRYYAIMTQVTTAQGDMARTLNAPANQLRVLQAQVTQAARALGNIFIPILNAVLPIAIAAAKAIQFLASSIASLFGFSMPEVDYSGIEGAAGGVGDLNNALNSANGSAKKLKNTLAKFDELNVISSESSGGGGGGAGGGGGNWDWELPEYDFLGEAVSSRIDAIMKKIQPALDWVKEHLDEVLAVAEAIGLECLAWSVAKSFLPSLGTIRERLSKILGVATAVGTAVVTISLVYKFDNNFMNTGKYGYLIADGIATAMGSAISGIVMASQFGTTSGLYTASAVLAISAITSISVIFDKVSTEGFSSNAAILGIVASIKGALAGSLIAKALGVSIIAGAGIGFVVTAGITVAATLVAAEMKKNNMRAVAVWGKIALTAAEAKAFASKLFEFDVTAKINLINSTIENEQTAKNNLNEKMATFSSDLNLIKLGVIVDDSEGRLTSMVESLTGEGGIIASVQSMINAQEKTIELAVSLVPPKTTEGEDISANLMTSIGLSSQILSDTSAEIGKKLSEAISQGMIDGLNDDEKRVIAELSGWLNRIETAVSKGRIAGEFDAGVNILLSDLTEESFGSTLQAFGEMKTELEQSYMTLEKQAYANAVAYAAGLSEAKAYYDSVGDVVNAEQTQQALDAVNAQIANWDVGASVQAAVDEATQPGRQAILSAFQTIFGNVMNQVVSQTPIQGLANEALYGVSETMTDAQIQEYANGLANRLNVAMQMAFGDNYQVAMDVSSMFGMSGWELLTTEVKQQIYDVYKTTFGSTNTQAMFESLGYDLSEIVVDGMENSSASGETAAQTYLDEVTGTLTDGKSEIEIAAQAACDGAANAGWYEAGKQGATSFANGIRSVPMPAPRWSGLSIGGGMKLNTPSMSFYADGGFPPTGDMFIANENGAEMVGRIGRKTAVANNEQITEGITNSVSIANTEQNALLREQNVYLRQLVAKENKVQLVPSAGLARTVAKSNQMLSKATGD